MTIPAIAPPPSDDDGFSGGLVEDARVFVASPIGQTPVG
jgi:hypothetical protein